MRGGWTQCPTAMGATGYGEAGGGYMRAGRETGLQTSGGRGIRSGQGSQRMAIEEVSVAAMCAASRGVPTMTNTGNNGPACRPIYLVTLTLMIK